MRVIFAVLVAVIMALPVPSNAEEVSGETLLVVTRSVGMWRSTAGEVWRIALDNERGIVFMADQIDMLARMDNSDTYLNPFNPLGYVRFALELGALGTFGTVEIESGIMRIVTDDGGVFVAERVRDLNARDLDHIEQHRAE